MQKKHDPRQCPGHLSRVRDAKGGKLTSWQSSWGMLTRTRQVVYALITLVYFFLLLLTN